MNSEILDEYNPFLLLFPRYILLGIFSLFFSISIIITGIILTENRLSIEKIIIFTSLTILILVILVWLWYHPVINTYQNNMVQILLKNQNKQKLITAFNPSNPLRIMFFSAVKPKIPKDLEFISTFKDLRTTLEKFDVIKAFNSKNSEEYTIQQYRKFETSKKISSNLLFFLDSNNLQVFPPLGGNIRTASIWENLSSIKSDQNFPIQIEYVLTENSFRSYWGYWVFAELCFELRLRFINIESELITVK